MCTIADAKVRQNYNCYNVYFNECLRKFDSISSFYIAMYIIATAATTSLL